MITMKALMDLTIAMPKCSVKKPEDGISLIKDTNMNTVAHIDWNQSQIVVYNDYEFADELIEAIGKDRFDISDPVEFEEPEFEPFEIPKESVEALYEPPKTAPLPHSIDDEPPF